MSSKAIPISERLWAGVNKDGPLMPGMTTPCWVWIKKAKTELGYGLIGSGGRGGLKRAHRVAWELEHGAIPAATMVLHHCDNPPCVRPSHLFLGNHAVNMADMEAKGRAGRNYGEKNGRHKLTDSEREEVRSLHCTGIGYRRLSRMFHVSRPAIRYIVTGKGSYAEQKARKQRNLGATP